MKRQLEIEAPAKVNLTLKVLGKREDGYHELESVMQQISLRDKIYLQVGGQGIRAESNSQLIPDNEENLAFQAAQLLYTKFSIKEGLQIFIEKNIPVGAGLAGGSTDAAAVMIGINELFNLGLEKEELMKLGLAIGSDVPFCLLGGTALARGRGEILTDLGKGPQLAMLLVKPDYQLSTGAVYRDFRVEKVKNSPDNTAFLEAWHKYDMIGIVGQMINVLETVSLDMCPEIEIIKTKLDTLGATKTLMSGSGPSVIGVFASQERAQQAWDLIKDQYREAYLVSSYNRGD
ncbi:MAG: 4-(cytidine 5'-diphospho)-2-C-methyl-D-erythritol kinase [Firmicutes bacterium HGW-Firmicutes-15]|nr:MAG: 4-(cytidine 5'-diphospho)-2-C-methyl-D-erythritol kinase [Firmicutes bacterium HGW-Firmicutes-15]